MPAILMEVPVRLISLVFIISFSICKVPTAAPAVVATIAPVHSLVAAVMGDLGQPTLLLSSREPPHAVALRPSQARALARADLIVWVGRDMERWLVKPLETLGNGALSLVEVDGTLLLPTRQFGQSHAHGGQQVGVGLDPHLWLSPENAKLWTAAIAATLGQLDPQNAAIYDANARQANQDIDLAAREVVALLAGIADRRFVVLHDALQYFERRFGVEAVGSLADISAEHASVARMTNLQSAVADGGVGCALYEPEQGAKSFEGLRADHKIALAMVDPTGLTIEPGPGLYPALLRKIAQSMVDCHAK